MNAPIQKMCMLKARKRKQELSEKGVAKGEHREQQQQEKKRRRAYFLRRLAGAMLSSNK